MPDPTATSTLRFNCLAIEDALAVSASPGSLLIEISDDSPIAIRDRAAIHAKAKVLAAGPTSMVDRHAAAAGAQVINLPNSVLIPGLVNAHTHLDLTHIGPKPYDPARGFVGFVDVVRAGRRQDDESIAAAVRLGVELALAGGVVAVGDIAGSAAGVPRLAPYEELLRSPLWGVSYLEYFAIGKGEEAGTRSMAEAVEEGVRFAASRGAGSRMRFGLQPHAPYSVSRRAYMKGVELAQRYGLPLSTHLSESPSEVEFVARGTGPQRELLTKLGVWDDSILMDVGQEKSPVEHLSPVLNYGDFTVAHVNYATDRDVFELAGSRTGVVFCPRCAAYFEAAEKFGPHRYLDMMFCGVHVGLGTDSIVNLPPTRDPETGSTTASMSILEEMRLLYRRDAIRAITLLGMATMDGATVLGLDPLSFTFKRGAQIAGIVAVAVQKPEGGQALDLPLDRIMMGNQRPELLLIGK